MITVRVPFNFFTFNFLDGVVVTLASGPCGRSSIIRCDTLARSRHGPEARVKIDFN